MTWIHLVKCPNCQRFYDDTLQPCIGLCFHTICLSCKEQLIFETCPVCNMRNAFYNSVINHGVLEIMKNPYFKQVVNEEKDLTSGTCSECQFSTRKLRICSDCSTPDFDNFHPELSILNGKCHGICSDCAFENHDGHQIDNFTVEKFGELVEKNNLKKLIPVLLVCMRSMIGSCDSQEEIDEKLKYRLKVGVIELIDIVMRKLETSANQECLELKNYVLATLTPSFLGITEIQEIDKYIEEQIDKDYSNRDLENLPDERPREYSVLEDLKAIVICKRLIDNFDSEYSNGLRYFTKFLEDLHKEPLLL